MHPTIRKALTNRYLIIAAVAVLVYALAGFVAVPGFLRWYVPGYAARHLDCRAAVDRIAINPFLLTIEVNGLSLQQKDGAPLVGFERLFVDLEASSLLQWAIVLQKVDLARPEVHLVAEADGSLNLARLASSPQPDAAAEADAGPLPLILRHATIREGRLAVVDKRPGTPAGFTLQALDLDLQGFATVKDQNGTCHLAAVTDAGESIRWEGEIALAPFRSTGKLTLGAVRTASLWQFVRDSVNLEEPEGRIDLATAYRLNAGSSPLQLTLEGLHLSITELALKLPQAEKAFFQARKLELEAPRFDSVGRDLHVARLLLGGGAIDARINEAGGLNLQQVIRRALPPKSEPRAPPPPAAVDRSFTVKADAVDIRDVAVTIDDRSRKVPVRAAIAGADLHLQAELAVGGGPPRAVLSRIAGEWRGIRIDRGRSPQPLFAATTLTAEGGAVDLGARSLSLERLALRRGGLDVVRDAAGNIDWQGLLQPNATVAKSQRAKLAPAAGGPAWKYLVKSFEIEAFTAGFTDLTTSSAAPVLNLQDFKARLTGIDGRSPMNFTVGWKMAPGGSATVSGTVDPAGPSVEAEIEAADVALTSLQPYLDPYVTLKLESALASAKGRLRYGFPGDAAKAAFAGNFSLNGLRLVDPAAGKPYLGVDAVRLPKFSLTLQPNGLKAQEIRISRPVGELIIGEDKTLNLARVLKDRPAGAPPSSPPAADGGRPGNDRDAFAFDISRIQVEGGDMVFADLSLQPQFKTRIHDLKGAVTGLSSKPGAQARVQLDGQVDRYGIARINGVIRPDDFRRSSDLNLVFRNLEMKSLSPYSGKFAGRLITSGKISADLKYKLQDYRMMGDNKIVIDNLILGEQVGNPDAANLPLDLALALLRDSSGRIDIGLPVTGDLNDPHFNFGSLVRKMIANVITRTATAPFQVLAKMFGGKVEKFDRLTFDPGSAELPPPEKEKLAQLAAALERRPQLKLIVQGRYSSEADGVELRTRSLRRTVAARLGEEIEPEDRAGPIDFGDSDARDILEELYVERFGKQALNELEEAFTAGATQPRASAAKGRGKASEARGLAKLADDLKLYTLVPGGMSHDEAVRWAEELYSRLLESEAVAEADLRRLAEARAQSIVVGLEGEGRIAKARIAVKAAEPQAAKAQPSATLALDVL